MTKIYLKFLFSSPNGSKETAAARTTETLITSSQGPQSLIWAVTGEISTGKANVQLLRDKVV